LAEGIALDCECHISRGGCVFAGPNLRPGAG
jgi:hypothetical protein